MKASLWMCAAAALSVVTLAGAQPVRNEKITVTASPLGRGEAEMAQPATVLDEEQLRRRRAASLGDTLANEPGVQSSAFGAAAGRPIIRGMDGPRVRVLENGIGTGDASSVSPDHAVTTESLRAEQIEVLRGPASLLYGSGAIGGVVNVVSKLVPRAPAEGLRGDAELRASSGDRERSGAVNLDGGGGMFAWHLDGFRRRTGDYRIPSEAIREGFGHGHEHDEGDEEAQEEAPSVRGRLPNSDVDAGGAAAGASWVGSRGHAGGGLQRLESDYGVPTGEGVRIRMRQERYEGSAELADPFAGFTRLRLRAGRNDYRHDEVEADGGVGTTFTQRATESRLELRHEGIVRATVGGQWQDSDMAAVGEEAILPRTRSRAAAAFVVAERDWGRWTLDLGVRAERERRTPEGALPARRFSLVTPAAGLVLRLPEDHRFAIAATQARRAPSVEELYSRGAHHATATFDIGDPFLRAEVSRNVDVTLRKASGEVRWRVNLYANRVRDYVFAASQDADGDGVADRVDEDGVLDPAGEFLVQRFSQAGARFRGIEAEWSYRPAGSAFGLRLFGDVTRARLAEGTNLPRIAPARFGVELDVRRGALDANLMVLHALAQRRVAPLESPTPSYVRVDAELAWRVEGAAHEATVFLQGRNLLDEEIRLHTSYLKDRAPQMGRSFTLGLRMQF